MKIADFAERISTLENFIFTKLSEELKIWIHFEFCSCLLWKYLPKRSLEVLNKKQRRRSRKNVYKGNGPFRFPGNIPSSPVGSTNSEKSKLLIYVIAYGLFQCLFSFVKLYKIMQNNCLITAFEKRSYLGICAKMNKQRVLVVRGTLKILCYIWNFWLKNKEN